MLIDREALLGWQIPPVRQTYTARDAILYALGLGAGTEPGDLRFTYERGLQPLPMMALVLGYPGLWIADPRIGARWQSLLHGEQSFTIVRPLPPEGAVIGTTRVTDVVDKGAERGLFVCTERQVVLESSGELLCTLRSTSVLRADGGLGGAPGRTAPPHRMPEGRPDAVVDKPTLPQAALIYRLSGDYNPLHVDPEVAAAAGFPRPILHGMCTFGVAGLALIGSACGGEAARLSSMRARFTAPVFPGETLRTEIWRGDGCASFRCTALERGVVALDNGLAAITLATGTAGDPARA